jgi:hypothetical protein
MPLTITRTAGDTLYPDPFIQAGHVASVIVDVSALTTTFVDANGYLKPGAIFRADGTLITTTGQTAFGMVRHPIKVAAGNDSTSLNAATDIPVPVVTHGIVNQTLVADLLGRVLSANELSALTTGGANIVVR